MTNTCSGCTAVWTAPTAAHCAAEECHRTFAAVSLFDKHRSAEGEHGTCLEPASVGLEFRNGMWRGPEMTEEQKVALYGHRNTERAA